MPHIPGGLFVSIHASVKDATCRPLRACLQAPVSIHASVKDATMLPGCYDAVLQFQSTRP